MFRMRKFFTRALPPAALCLSLLVSAQAGPTLEPMRAFVHYEFGQVENGINFDGLEGKEMISRAAVWTLHEASLNDDARFRFGVGGVYFFVNPRNLGANPFTHSKRSAVGITEAHGEFDLVKSADGDYVTRLKAGIFGYKYNPDAKNLGEYLYRTWTYPNVITTGGLEFINSAGAQLSGAALQTRAGGFENDLILSIQSDRPPIFGLSLANIASYTFGGFLTVGAGFMFDNFYNPDEEQVRPTDDLRNAYYTLSDGSKMAHTRYAYEVQEGRIDPGTVSITDTGYYTLAGQKAMARASIDLGALLDHPRVAPGQFRVYGELAVLGLKDYPTYYENLEDRIVYMGGVNIPTFGLLDMLSVEVQYFSNPFENSTEGPLSSGSITPFVSQDGWASYRRVYKDDVKWTVYARKEIVPGFSIYAQVADDHMRMLDVFSTPDFREFLPERDHWYWALKLAWAL
jgi:hypothetical protein